MEMEMILIRKNRKITIDNIINDTNNPLMTWWDFMGANICHEIYLPVSEN